MAGFNLTGCRAVITGASSGLGVEFARQLAPQASALLLIARRLPELEHTRDQVLALHPKLQVQVLVADIGTDAGREAVWQATAGFSPDFLINNAGVGDYGRFDDAPADRLRAQLEVNITGLVMLTHALLPLLKRPVH